MTTPKLIKLLTKNINWNTIFLQLFLKVFLKKRASNISSTTTKLIRTLTKNINRKAASAGQSDSKSETLKLFVFSSEWFRGQSEPGGRTHTNIYLWSGRIKRMKNRK